MTTRTQAEAERLAETLNAWRNLSVRWRLTGPERQALLPESGAEVTLDHVGVRMRILVEIGHRLRGDDDQALRDWLRTPILMFAFATPLEVMAGPMADLLRFRGLVERGDGLVIGPRGVAAVPLDWVLSGWDTLVDHRALDDVERSLLLGGFASGNVDAVATYDAAVAEERMRLLIELGLVLDRVHGDQRRTRLWLRAPNRRLGGSSPIDTMATSTAWMRWMVDHVGLTA